MIVLVGFISVEGQTRRIAERVAQLVEGAGAAARLFDVASMAEYALERPAAAILCAPIHGGRYPAPFVGFVMREKQFLAAIPTAFVSVSLYIASDEPAEREEAERFPLALAAETGWHPALIHNAAGALRYSEYDFFKRWMAKRLAGREGKPTDTSSDYEFTDYAALADFVHGFVESAAA